MKCIKCESENIKKRGCICSAYEKAKGTCRHGVQVYCGDCGHIIDWG